MIHLIIAGLPIPALPPLGFMQQAPAPGQPQAPGPLVQFVIPLAVVFAIFYFLVIRPANKKQKALQEMLNALKNGDRVVTTGGIYGTVAGISDAIVQLKIANNVKIEVSRNAIAGLQKEE